MMLPLLRSALVALAVLCVSASAAVGADWCFEDVEGVTLFAQEFALPAKGRCRPLQGHTALSTVQIVSGTACRTSDGTTLLVGFTMHPVGNSPFIVGQMDISFPSLASGTVRFRKIAVNGDITTGTGDASAAPCNPPHPIIP